MNEMLMRGALQGDEKAKDEFIRINKRAKRTAICATFLAGCLTFLYFLIFSPSSFHEFKNDFFDNAIGIAIPIILVSFVTFALTGYLTFSRYMRRNLKITLPETIAPKIKIVNRSK